jgi:acyl dehydratase
MGFVAQSVTDWLGVGSVRKVGVRFASLVRLGDVITCRGTVVAKRPAKDGVATPLVAPAGSRMSVVARGENMVDLEIWAENQKGEKVVTGKATAALPSRE